MKWHLRNRQGKSIAAGTLEQLFTYLRHLVPDGEYQLVGSELSIPVRRYRGKVIYPAGLEDFLSSHLHERPRGE